MTDMAATRKPVSALSRKEESVRISKVEIDRILMTQEEPKKLIGNNNKNEGEDGRGVLYCELDTDDNLANQQH